MINFKGQVVLPLDLNVVYFRFIVADEHGALSLRNPANRLRNRRAHRARRAHHRRRCARRCIHQGLSI